MAHAKQRVVQERLRRLFFAGFVDRCRPLTARGSYQWTYGIAGRGFQVAKQCDRIPEWAKFTPRQEQVFDYRYIVHHLRVNAWVMAYRRILGETLIDWEGPEEARLECPPAGARATTRSATTAGSPNLSRAGAVTSSPTRRSRSRLVVFVCDDAHHRQCFMAAADREVTGRLSDYGSSSGPRYLGRQRIAFVDEQDIYQGERRVHLLPERPPRDPDRVDGEPDGKTSKLLDPYRESSPVE